MRVAERATPIAAVIAALSTLACCLPFGFLGAMGLAGLSLWARSYGGWLLALAAILLIVGFVQLYHRRNQCKKRSGLSGLKPLGTVLWRLAPCTCSDSFDRRLCAAISPSQSVQETQWAQRRVVLDRCRDSSCDCSVSPNHCELGSWLNSLSCERIGNTCFCSPAF